MTVNLGLTNQTLVNAYNTGGFEGVQQQLGVDDAAFTELKPKIIELLLSDSMGTMKADGHIFLDPPEVGSSDNLGVLSRNLSDMSYGDVSFDLTSVLMAFTKSAQSVRESSMKARDASFNASVVSTESGIAQMQIASDKNYAAAKKEAMMTMVAGATTVAASTASLAMTTKGINDEFGGKSAQAEGAETIRTADADISAGKTQITEGMQQDARLSKLTKGDDLVEADMVGDVASNKGARTEAGEAQVANGQANRQAGLAQMEDGLAQQKKGELMKARGQFADGAGRGLSQTMQGIGGAMSAEDKHAADNANVEKAKFDLQASIQKETNQQHKDTMQQMLDLIRDTASKAQSMLESSGSTKRSINTV